MNITIISSLRKIVKEAADSCNISLRDAGRGAENGCEILEVEAQFGSEPGLLVGRAGHSIIKVDGVIMESLLGAELQVLKRTLAVAESCTGGLLGAAVTSIVGSSAHFRGGIISYSDDVKTKLLGVSKNILSSKGAVSSETAICMAEGARHALAADYGLSITGIAGPSGGIPGKPVGTVFIGIAGEQGAFAINRLFEGSRQEVRQQSVNAAIAVLWAHLRYGNTDF